jgi:phage terminase Nu1 subunit (DNA packaging protein)
MALKDDFQNMVHGQIRRYHWLIPKRETAMNMNEAIQNLKDVHAKNKAHWKSKGAVVVASEGKGPVLPYVVDAILEVLEAQAKEIEELKKR